MAYQIKGPVFSGPLLCLLVIYDSWLTDKIYFFKKIMEDILLLSKIYLTLHPISHMASCV